MDSRVAKIKKLMAQVSYEQEFSEEIEDDTIIDEVYLQLESLKNSGKTENIKMLATIFLDDIAYNILNCPVCGIDLSLRGAEIVSLFDDLHPNLSLSIYHLARWVKVLNIGLLFEEHGYTISDIDRIIRDKTVYPLVISYLKKLRKTIGKEDLPTVSKSHKIIIDKLHFIEQSSECEKDEKVLAAVYRKYLEDPQRLEMIERRKKQFG